MKNLRKYPCSGITLLIIFCFNLLSVESVIAEGQSMYSQTFFKKVPPIVMEDKLAVKLGAVASGGVFVYSYEDAVKMAGHSCLAVSGAYRLTQIALKKLYMEENPVRGEIEVIILGGVEHSVNGPISQVVTYITGAAAENGFKGFRGGEFRRYNLLRFDENHNPPADALCAVIFKRMDTGKSVEVTYRKNMLPSNLDMQEMVKKVLMSDVENMFVTTEN